MSQEITWEIGGGNGEVASTKKKLPFVTPIKITETMDDNQKTFFSNYNNMQKELIRNGLMESK